MTTAKKLRQSILQAAVQGKLVPQNSDDEPAGELLARIRAERAKDDKKKKEPESVIFRGSKDIEGTKEGRFYEQVGSGPLKDISEELPFDIPKSWEWVRLGHIGIFERGKGIKKNEIHDSGCPCIRYGEIYTSYDISFINIKSFK